jgi:hypothetical protein
MKKILMWVLYIKREMSIILLILIILFAAIVGLGAYVRYWLPPRDHNAEYTVSTEEPRLATFEEMEGSR